MNTTIIKIEPHGKDFTLECPKTKLSTLLSSCIECDKHKQFNIREKIVFCSNKKKEKK